MTEETCKFYRLILFVHPFLWISFFPYSIQTSCHSLHGLGPARSDFCSHRKQRPRQGQDKLCQEMATVQYFGKLRGGSRECHWHWVHSLPTLLQDNLRRFKRQSYTFQRREDVCQCFENFEGLSDNECWELSLKVKPRNRTSPVKVDHNGGGQEAAQHTWRRLSFW